MMTMTMTRTLFLESDMAYNSGMTSPEALNAAQGRLQTACLRAWRLNQVMEELVPHREVSHDDVVSQTRVTAAPPWHTRAALLVMDLHALAREQERVLILEVSDNVKVRGGSDLNTHYALDALPRLAEAVDAQLTWSTVFAMERWVHRAEELLGLVEPLRHLPTAPGEREPRCPWCGYLTLRWQMRLSRIRCVNPGCRVDVQRDRRPTGYLKMNLDTGVTEIVWDDELPSQQAGVNDA